MNAQHNIASDRYCNCTEIDLFELLRSIYQQKKLIIIISLLSLLSGILYSFTVTPNYTIMATISPGSDLSASLELSKQWNSYYGEERKFTTPITAKYASNEPPYSQTSLFLRYAEAANSKRFKDEFIKENPHELNFKTIKNIKAAIPKKNISTIILRTKLYLNNSTDISISKSIVNQYISWSIKRFSDQISKESTIFTSNNKQKSLTIHSIAQIQASAFVSEHSINSNKYFISFISLAIGIIISLIVCIIRIEATSRTLVPSLENKHMEITN